MTSTTSNRSQRFLDIHTIGAAAFFPYGHTPRVAQITFAAGDHFVSNQEHDVAQKGFFADYFFQGQGLRDIHMSFALESTCIGHQPIATHSGPTDALFTGGQCNGVCHTSGASGISSVGQSKYANQSSLADGFNSPAANQGTIPMQGTRRGFTS